MESSKFVIGLLRETVSSWEGRVALTPKAVSKFCQKGVKVFVQTSSTRCFEDQEYEEAGGILCDKFDESASKMCILGIKPISPATVLPNATYLLYTRIASGLDSTKQLKESFVSQKCTLIDYECIKDERGIGIVGSSRLAGRIGCFNTLRGLGEYLLLKGCRVPDETGSSFTVKKLRTPFLMAGSTYMYESYKDCVEKIHKIRDTIAEKPFRIANHIGPIIFGIMGRGLVGMGAKDVLEELGATQISTLELEDISKLDSTKSYYVVLGRKHHLQKEDNEEFDEADFLKDTSQYKVVFYEKYLPKLTVFINCINWDKRYPKLITTDQMNAVLDNPLNRLKVIGDLSCLPHGPIEFLHKNKHSEEPFYYYDSTNGLVDSHAIVSDKSLLYLAVEMLPAELPKDASQMFEDSLSSFLDKLTEVEDQDLDSIAPEFARGCIIKNGEITERYMYLSS